MRSGEDGIVTKRSCPIERKYAFDLSAMITFGNDQHVTEFSHRGRRVCAPVYDNRSNLPSHPVYLVLYTASSIATANIMHLSLQVHPGDTSIHQEVIEHLNPCILSAFLRRQHSRQGHSRSSFANSTFVIVNNTITTTGFSSRNSTPDNSNHN